MGCSQRADLVDRRGRQRCCWQVALALLEVGARAQAAVVLALLEVVAQALPAVGVPAPAAAAQALLEAVARVQAQQAALKAKSAQASPGMAPENMQSLGEGLGRAVRTFKDAAADIKNSIDPQMRSIQAELEAAEKEMQETIEVAKQPGSPKETSG